MNYRKPLLYDVEDIHQIINRCAEDGLMLPRSRNMLYETIRDFVVVEEEGNVVAAGALHVIWDDLAEIRALAVEAEHQKKGLGKGIVERLVLEAKALGCSQVFALTYQPGFFLKCGFSPVHKDSLPQKVWKECINCAKFPNCDESAVILAL